jgi:hypothetical protein
MQKKKDNTSENTSKDIKDLRVEKEAEEKLDDSDLVDLKDIFQYAVTLSDRFLQTI